MRVTVSGRFQNTGAQAAVDAIKALYDTPQYTPVSESETVNAYDGSVQFQFDFIDLTASESDYISWNESTSIEYSLQDFVIHTVLGGGVPIEQNTVVRPASATQSGSAIKSDAFPTPPVPLWATASMKRQHVTKSGPDTMPGGKETNFRLSWNYSFEFAADPVFHDPNTVP